MSDTLLSLKCKLSGNQLYRIIRKTKNYFDNCIADAFSLLPIKKNYITLVGDGEFRDSVRVFFDYAQSSAEYKRTVFIILVDDIKKYRSLKKKNVKVVRRISVHPLILKNYYLSVSKVIIYTHGISITNRRSGQLVVHTTHSAAQLKAIPHTDIKKAKKTIYSDYHLRCGNEGVKIFMEGWNLPEEKLPITGLPRLDLLFKHRDVAGSIDSGFRNKKIVIALETFKRAPREGYVDSNTIDAYGLNIIHSQEDFFALSDFLMQNNILLLIKPHPKQALSDLVLESSRSIRYITDAQLDSMGIQLYELIENCDALLTDYSSVFYDYLLLDRPIGFMLGDYSDYKRGFVYEDPLSEMPGEKIKNTDDLFNFFSCLISGVDEWKSSRALMRNKVFTYQDDQNCSRLSKFIQEKTS